MPSPRTNEEVMHEMNDRAKAEGRYLGVNPWDIPRESGSVFDVPKTEKSKADLAWFRAEREKRRQAEGRQIEKVQESTQRDAFNVVRKETEE